MSELRVRDIKKGDVFVETSDFGEESPPFIALADAKSEPAPCGNGRLAWRVTGLACIEDQYEIEFMETEGLEHYGPELEKID